MQKEAGPHDIAMQKEAGPNDIEMQKEASPKDIEMKLAWSLAQVNVMCVFDSQINTDSKNLRI